MSALLVRRAATLAAISLIVGTSSAGAQSFAGYTTGCFGIGCTPTSAEAYFFPSLAFAGTGSVGTPTTFGTAVGGNLTLGNLGQFTLARSMGGASYTGAFSLGITFTQPGGSDTFAAALTGSLNNGGNGSVVVNFGPAQLVTYAGGSFLVTVDDLTVTSSGNPVNITGSISNAMATSTVPEPATVAMLGTGLLGLVGVARRRQQQAK